MLLFYYSNFCFILALLFVICGSIIAVKKKRKSILVSSYLLASICIFVGLATIQL